MKTLVNRLQHTGDLWGGIAAMLVALPAAIAFGVTIYATIGPNSRRSVPSPGSSAPP